MKNDKDIGKSWAKPTCKYYAVCGSRFNCKGCTGYKRKDRA